MSPSFLHSTDWRLRGDKRRNIAEKVHIDTNNIFADDLAATLEAHRVENRARVVRKLGSDVERGSVDFYRPLISNPGPQQSEYVATERTASVLKPDDELTSVDVTGPQSTGLSVTQDVLIEGKKTKQWRSWPTNSIQHTNMFGEKTGKRHRDQCSEYEGGNLKPCNRWARNYLQPHTGTRLQSPWLAFMSHKFSITSLGRLGAEIRAFESYMLLSQSEQEAFASAKAEALAIVQTALPSAVMRTIGSYSNGLATPTSDIDFRLILPEFEKKPLHRGPSPGRPESRRKYFSAFGRLGKAFARSDSFHRSTVVHAAIKIIKAVHRQTNLTINIQISSSEIPSQMYKEMYLNEFCTLRPLYILLRAALEIRGLKTTLKGGLGSYSIFMMIVYALKTCPPNIDSNDCANQLLHVLQLYSDVDLYTQGFSVDPPAVFPKSGIPGGKDNQRLYDSGINKIRKIKQHQPYLLCLQDPADPNNDLGTKAYAIKHVQKVFGCARREIEKALNNISTADGDSNQSMLDSLVGANYDSFKNKRMRMYQYANSRNLQKKSLMQEPKIEKTDLAPEATKAAE